MPAGFGGQLDPHPDLGFDPQLGGAIQDNVQFARHFQHEKAVEPHAQSVQTEVDKFLVLVAVADQTGLAALQLRHGRDELGLGPHFQPVVIGGAVLGYLFHHLLLLVDLDREHAPVGPLVPQFADGGAEGLVQQRNLRIENVFDTQQNRHVVAAFLDFVDDFQHADFRTSFAPEGPDDDLAQGDTSKYPAPQLRMP